MATQSNNMAQTDRERLAEVSLEGCYLETLVEAVENAFEDIDLLCDEPLPGALDLLEKIRAKARFGLNMTYMAQDKADTIKRAVDMVEGELWRAERDRRAALPSGRA